jgi:hypothetical protein
MALSMRVAVPGRVHPPSARDAVKWDPQLVRALGAAFVFVFLASFIGGLLSPLLFATAPELLGRLADDAAPVRAGNLLQVLTSAGIVVLASLLYLCLRDASRPLALMALGWWLAEATMLAVSTLGVTMILALAADGTDPAASGSLAAILLALQQGGVAVHMLFFCLGALVWYGLMWRTRLVPRWLAAWGFAGCALMLADTLVMVFDPGLTLGAPMYGPYVPFELVIGLWLLARGAPGPNGLEA